MAIEAERLKEEMARESREHALALELAEADTKLIREFFLAGKCFVKLMRGEERDSALEEKIDTLRLSAVKITAMTAELTGEGYRSVAEQATDDVDTVLEMCELYDSYLECYRALELDGQ